MRGAFAIAVAAGAVWGLVTPHLYGRTTLADVLLMEGLLLAAAWGVGHLASSVRAGAAAGALLMLAYYGGREITPWTGVEADIRAHGVPADIARQFRDAYDYGTSVDWRVALAGVALAAAAGTRHRAAWALLAGALAAGFFNAVPNLGLDVVSVVAVLTALAGAGVAVRLVAPRRALPLALLPIAVVWVGPHLLGTDVIGGHHPEVRVIR